MKGQRKRRDQENVHAESITWAGLWWISRNLFLKKLGQSRAHGKYYMGFAINIISEVNILVTRQGNLMPLFIMVFYLWCLSSQLHSPQTVPYSPFKIITSLSALCCPSMLSPSWHHCGLCCEHTSVAHPPPAQDPRVVSSTDCEHPWALLGLLSPSPTRWRPKQTLHRWRENGVTG